MANDDQEFVVLGAADVEDFNEAGLLPLPATDINKIQKWLCPTDYAAASSEYGKHLSSHLAGTGDWIFQDEQFQRWHDSDRGALWIKAIAGAGKSVIAASLASKIAAEENVPVLYFFFRHIISANQKPQSLVRDWLSQILQYSPTAQHALHGLVDKRRSLDSVSFDELWQILVSSLTLLPRVYCVADALDEMDAGNESFLQNLVELGKKQPATVKLLLTSRPVPHVERHFRDASVLQIMLLQRLVDPDISVYVKHRLETCVMSQRSREQIHETMSAKADGHFLYARLMMDDLLDPSKELLSNEDALSTALTQLPTPMADMYSQMLHQHAQRSGVPQELQLTLLRWVTRAERPLRLLELSSMIDFEQQALGMSKDTKSIVREGVGPLLEILADETVCPIHHSFTEYLYDLDRRNTPSGTALFPILDYQDTQRAIGLTCVGYLKSGWHHEWCDEDAKSDDRALKMKYPFLNYATDNWHRHVFKYNSDDSLLSSALDEFLVKDKDIMNSWLELSEHGQHEQKRYRQLSKRMTPAHVAAEKGLSYYLKHLIDQSHDVDVIGMEGKTPLALAAGAGMDGAVEILLNHGVRNDQDDDVGLKPLHKAAQRNHDRIVKLLLASGVDPYTPKTQEYPGRWCGNSPSSIGDTPVEYAAKSGHVEAMKAFIPYFDKEGLNKALYWATREGSTKVSMHLLEVPGVDVNCVVNGRTPLWLASMSRDVKVMRALVNRGAMVMGRSIDSGSHIGVSLGNPSDRTANPMDVFAASNMRRISGCKRLETADWIEGLEILLDAGLDPNFVNRNGSTVLHTMVSHGHGRTRVNEYDWVYDILIFLFSRGLDARVMNGDGSNALHLATNMPSTVLELLVKHGVDVNQVRKHDSYTPLLSALDSNMPDTARSLLRLGADPSIADASGNTPLHILVKKSNYMMDLDMFKILIAAGGNVNGKNHDGDSPLHVGECKKELLDLFIENGFDLEIKNHKGHSTLMHSLSISHFRGFHELLEEAGADLQTRANDGRTVLHMAVRMIHDIGIKTTDLVRHFVKRGVDPLAVDYDGNNLWHIICRQGADYHQLEQLAVMKLLHELGVPPLGTNNAGQTPIHTASSVPRGHYDYSPMDYLLEHCGADLDVADHDFVRPIHLASSYDFKLTCFLIEHGVDASATTIDGQTPLMVATRTRECDIVSRLLDHHAEHGQLSIVNHTDVQGRTALHYACRSGRPETVRLLIEAGAAVDIKDEKGLTPLHACAEYLKEQGSWEHQVSKHSGDRTRSSYVLLRDRTRPSAGGSGSDETPFRVRESVRLLFAHGAQLSFATSPHDSYTSTTVNPLALAINEGCYTMASELMRLQGIASQADVDAPEANTSTTFMSILGGKQQIHAFEGHRANVLDSYYTRIRMWKMRYMPDVISKTVRLGESHSDLLHNLYIVEKLLEEDDELSVEEAHKFGANFLKLDYNGGNVLYLLASGGFTDLMRKVGQGASTMNAAWAKEMAPQHLNWDRLPTILEKAIQRRLPNLDMVKLLVDEFDVEINQDSRGGATYDPRVHAYLHILAYPQSWWQTKALDYLLSKGVNIEAKNSTGDTPLLEALCHSYDDPNCAEAVRVLLRHGADPNAVTADGKTCLNRASVHPEYMKLLLDHGANPSLGRMPVLLDAVRTQNLAILKQIVQAGVDVNIRAERPPKEAEVSHSDDDFDQLYDRFVEGECKNWSDILNTNQLAQYAYPIHVAASRFFNDDKERDNALSAIELLLQAGADPWLSYDDGMTIIHLLAEDEGIIEPFIDEVSLKRDIRDSRGRSLLLASCDAKADNFCENRTYNKVPFYLLEHGATLNTTDHAGRNALHCLISAYPGRKVVDDTIADLLKLPLGLPLIHQPDATGRMPLHYALAENKHGLIDVLLSHGADPLLPDPKDGSTALHHLVPKLPKVLDTLFHEPKEVMARIWASKSNSGSEAEDLHMSPDEYVEFTRSQTRPSKLAKSHACSPRRHIAALVARGADLNARDNAGETPLHWLLAKLVSKQWDSTSKLGGRTPQLLASLKFLERAGPVDFVARNASCEGVLHKLVLHNLSRMEPMYLNYDENKAVGPALKECFQWLVAKGVDVGWEDDGHRTCLDVAAAAGSEWALQLYERK